MSSHRARGQLGLSAGGLWSWGHLLGMAVPLLMLLSAAISPALVTRHNRGLGTVQNMVAATTLLQAEQSRAAPVGARWKRSSAESSELKSESLQTTYTGPTFLGFDCFEDKTPSVLKMPTACRTSAGGKKYTGKERMARAKVNLFQLAETRRFTASFCRVEKSSSAFLCGTQDWTQVLSPPKVGESEVLSGHACRDMLTSKTFVDLTYHRKFSVKVPGVTVRAYTARGTLQASGQDIYCYGSVGRVLDGTTVRNSMVFVSYRVTTGTLEGRREVRGARRAVITSGPLNGVEIDPKQAMGNSVILGSVTIVLDANFQDDSCPLARIKKGLEMFVLPRGGEQLGELSTHPGDRMYSVNGRTGTPPGKLQNYTVLVTGSQDLVLNLGQERKMPVTCGSARYVETSHSHVVATIDEKDDQTVEYLPLDLELVEATTEYSARLDLLSYITQQTLANLEDRLMSDTCIGDPEQLASLLEKASLENDDRVHRFVPAGEVVYRVACPKKRYGATGEGNCSELLPVKELSPMGKLEGEQLYILPQTRYTTRHGGGSSCPDLPSAYLADDGRFYSWTGGKLVLTDPQPKAAVNFQHLLPSGLPDFVHQVAQGQEIYTKEEEADLASRLDFGIFIHGDSEATLGGPGRSRESTMGTGSGASAAGGGSTWAMPGVTFDPEIIEHPALTPVTWLWEHVGAPIFHLLLTLGSIGGLMSVAGWLYDLIQQIKDLVRVGASLQGNGAIGKSLDLLGLSLSSSLRAQRIREGEQDRQAARMIRAQERVRSAISATSLPLQDGDGSGNEERTGF